jgi:hypothetical protein
MAVEINYVAPDDGFFVGTDFGLEYVLYEQPSDMTDAKFQALIDAALADDTVPDLVPIDLAGKTWAWVLRLKDKSPDPALIEKTSADGITIEGVYNADPSLNTQVMVVSVEDSDSYDPDASPAVELKPKKYRFSVKRMDDGFEQVHVFGYFQFLQATAR